MEEGGHESSAPREDMASQITVPVAHENSPSRSTQAVSKASVLTPPVLLQWLPRGSSNNTLTNCSTKCLSSNIDVAAPVAALDGYRNSNLLVIAMV
jgi:hypothetical protein